MISGVQAKDAYFHPFLQLGGGITMRCAEESAVPPEDVLFLNKRLFYMFGIQGRYKGKTAMVNLPKITVEYPNIISKVV